MQSYYIGDTFVGMVMTPPHTYYLGDEFLGINQDIVDWCNQYLPQEAYAITRSGFTIDNFYLNFKDTEAEAFFVMRWIK